MKKIRTEDAVGHVLCHDITQIIKGQTKDAVFRKGHVVTEADIPVLLSVGKENLYIWEKTAGMLHENEAADILRQMCQNTNMKASEPKEGKIELTAECDGLFKVDSQRLNQINALGQLMIATRHGNTAVKKGDKLAGMRIIPLVIEEKLMQEAQRVVGAEPILAIKPFLPKKAALVITGSEVFRGRIKDTFSPVIRKKVEQFGAQVISKSIMDDDPAAITAEIEKQIKNGAEFVLCTGGMSVDPDDQTPLAIKNSGAEIITYGAPVLPGAMFLLAYYDGKIPVVGLPGCVMYAKSTIFDLVLPRIMAGEKLQIEDFTILGEGGLCLSCAQCTYPNCGFGK